jgi:uncharacterized protein involved in outer membrane biogenesis
MRRLVLLLLGAIALVLILLLVGLGSLRTDGARRRIATVLSEAMGQPVSLGELSVTLLPKPGLAVREIRIGTESAGQPGISATELRVVPRLTSLLPGHELAIAEAALDSVVISARRDSSGRWLLPLPTRRAIDDSPAPAAAIGLADLRIIDGTIRLYDDRSSRTAGTVVTSITDLSASVRAAGGQISAAPLSGRLGRTRVSGAMLLRPDGAVIRLGADSIQPADVPAFLALLGVTSHPPIAIAGRAPFEMKLVAAPRFASYVVTGKASAERMRVGKLDLEQVQTPFRLERKTLTLTPIVFTAYGGREHGSVTVDLSELRML